MKCKKCGFKNEKGSRFCEQCGSELPKKKTIWFILFLIIFIMAGISVLLMWKKEKILPLLEKDNKEVIEKKKTVPQTDMEGIRYYASSEENVRTDKGITYVDNEILITLKSTQYRPYLEQYLKKNGGEIVGEIEGWADYQVLLDKSRSFSEMEVLIKDLEKYDWVDYAVPNYAMEAENISAIPNDSLWKDKWGNYPDDGNWGLEAIETPDAWEYIDKMQPVNVGVWDAAFCITHEDLDFVEEPLFNEDAIKANTEQYEIDHGTHVSGTIAAHYNNRKGIAGIAPKVNLYGVSFRGEKSKKYSFLQGERISLIYLIEKKKCKVINKSSGKDEINFNASRGSKFARQFLDIYNKEIEKILQKLIEHGEEFVLCKSAGNQNDKKGGYIYYLKDQYNDEEELKYYSSEDYEEYKKYQDNLINNIRTLIDSSYAQEKAEVGEELLKYFKAHEKAGDLKKRVENGGCLDSGNVDAKYNDFSGIEDETVQKRIIVVGAAKNQIKNGWFGKKEHKGYKIADFSECGDRVDILAPGYNIESTIGSGSGYGLKPGTSMAAPHVAGVAALIFSVNPQIKADDVKKIIKDTSVRGNGLTQYSLLNAKNAVEAALKYKNKAEEEKKKTSRSDIPSDAVEYQGHYYYVYDEPEVNDWNQAEAFCEDRGGYLATITSKAEDQFLYAYLRKKGYKNACFGLTNLETSNDFWEWVTGEAMVYENWAPGEPQDNDEYYGMYYERYDDGKWNDGHGKGHVFLCEWGDYDSDQSTQYRDGFNAIAGEKDIVLVLDTSGSMNGLPIDETKKASKKFADSVLQNDTKAAVVTYASTSTLRCNFSSRANFLKDSIEKINADGGTNLGEGLKTAYEKLKAVSNAKKQIIVLMSDGVPNQGMLGEELISYADEIKKEGILIYTLGFFENNSTDEKSEAQSLMEKLASEGCHYEVENAEELSLFFGDISDQINGQKFMYIRIACPVNVIVSYQGEELNSAKNNRKTRTSFGTLTFEEEKEETEENQKSLETELEPDNEKNLVKVLRLKEGVDYDVHIKGTGKGRMNYTIGYMNDDGEYKDFRKFKNIEITRKTVVDTVASVSDETVLQIDKDGDGKYDLYMQADKNGYGKEIEKMPWKLIILVGSGALILLSMSVLLVCFMRKKK